jgi:hypothetical protein
MYIIIITVESTLQRQLFSPSYKRITWQIYVQQIRFSFVSLKIKMDWPIMKFDGKNIIYIFSLVFYDILIFKWIMSF